MICIVAYVVIFIWSTWCVFSSSVKDGVIGRFSYSVIALAAFAAIVTRHPDTLERANLLLIYAVACIGLRHFIIKIYKTHRKPRI